MSSRSRHALLIGIDFYFPGDLRSITYPSLNGCVYDVQAVESFFAGRSGCRIRKLTSSVNPNNSSAPAETDKNTWPTCANIKQALESIEEEAMPGGLVYIHYSGHGIRRADCPVGGDGDKITGTALVPLDVNKGGAYLSGYQLGVWIRKMVEGEKKLRVTLVLDSCFSGGGLRKAHGVIQADGDLNAGFIPRTVENSIDKTILPSDEEMDKAVVEADVADKSTRNAMLRDRPSWLDNPTGCTTLSACQSNEVALEYKFAGENSRSGVLTFFLLRLLKEHSVTTWPTYVTVIENVRSKIQRMRPTPRQIPVLHGDANYEFFGDTAHQRPACRVLQAHGNFVKLAVGRAHAIAVGSFYEIYPRVSDTDGNGKDKLLVIKPITARVVEVEHFYADTVLVGDSKRPENSVIDSNCQAVLKSWGLYTPAYVSLLGLRRLPGLAIQSGLRDIGVVKLTESMSGLSLTDGSDRIDATFTVSNTKGGVFEITDKDGRLPRIPKISVKDQDSVRKIGHVLRQVARFRDVLAHRNHDPSTSLPASSFSFSLLDIDEEPIATSPSGIYELTHGQPIIISFTNNLPNARTYVSIFNLNATWGIEKLSPGIGQTAEKVSYYPLRLDPLEMQIPGKAHEEDPDDINDIFRAYVYVGKEPPVWDELILADLPLTAAELSVETAKAALVPPDALRNAKKYESAGPTADDRGKWTVLDIKIHTTRKVERDESKYSEVN